MVPAIRVFPAESGADPLGMRGWVGVGGRQALGAALRPLQALTLGGVGEMAGAGRQRSPVRAKPAGQPPAEPTGREDHGVAVRER
jgi:hypothetical protein